MYSNDGKSLAGNHVILLIIGWNPRKGIFEIISENTLGLSETNCAIGIHQPVMDYFNRASLFKSKLDINFTFST
jgi:hypothetical protein